jgi:cytochrome c oxidase subunit III
MSEARHAFQFDDLPQQREAAGLGMWTFLITEVLFFGGLFTGYTVYRITYPRAFAAASNHLFMWIGAVNTAVLLISSLTMALAVHAAEHRRRRALVGFIVATIALGCLFLSFKGVEYTLDIREHLVPGSHFAASAFADPRHAQLFYVFYFFMTGLHAIHVTAGLGVLVVLAVLAARGRFTQGNPNAVEMVGLYWHFVDIVWIFLLPLLYLIT